MGMEKLLPQISINEIKKQLLRFDELSVQINEQQPPYYCLFL
jgi:hypothetical protein